MDMEAETEAGYTVDFEPIIEERAPGLVFEWLYQLKRRNESALRFFQAAVPRLRDKKRIVNVMGYSVDPDVDGLRRAHARLEKAAQDVRDLELRLKARMASMDLNIKQGAA